MTKYLRGILIESGSIWEGRGLRIRVIRVGWGIAITQRTDLPKQVHAWALESFAGMRRVAR